MFTTSPDGYYLMQIPLLGLLTHFKTHGVQQFERVGGIYRNTFEVTRAAQVMRMRVLYMYMNNGETVNNRRNFAQVFT